MTDILIFSSDDPIDDLKLENIWFREKELKNWGPAYTLCEYLLGLLTCSKS
jgi:hypothetical protein